jgi:hypothetical protein
MKRDTKQSVMILRMDERMCPLECTANEAS